MMPMRLSVRRLDHPSGDLLDLEIVERKGFGHRLPGPTPQASDRAAPGPAARCPRPRGDAPAATGSLTRISGTSRAARPPRIFGLLISYGYTRHATGGGMAPGPSGLTLGD